MLVFAWMALGPPMLCAADQYEVGDTLHVWAPSGLNVREAPRLSAAKVGQLSMGTQVTVIEISPQTLAISVIAPRPDQFPDNIYQERGTEEPFYLKGNWVKVKSGAITGYVADMYLLHFPAFPEAGSVWRYAEQLGGKPLLPDTTWRDDCDGAPIVRCYEWEAISETGIRFGESYYMSAQDESISLPNLTVEEGFIFWSAFMPLADNDRRRAKLPLLMLMSTHEEGIWLLESDLCEVMISSDNGRVTLGQGCSD